MRIDGLVGLVNEFDAGMLEELRRRYPEQEQALSPGEVLGASSAGPATAALAHRALRIARAELEPCLDRIRSRLERANRLRLGGTVVLVPTSAGLITSALAAWPPVVTIITAVVNVGGALLTTAASFLETPSHGGQGSLIKIFEELARDSVRAQGVEEEIEAYLAGSGDGQTLADLVSQANSIAANLRYGLRVVGKRAA